MLYGEDIPVMSDVPDQRNLWTDGSRDEDPLVGIAGAQCFCSCGALGV